MTKDTKLITVIVNGEELNNIGPVRPKSLNTKLLTASTKLLA